eukprot:GILK01008714.1.p1 GENE.GILK01008714.1~~GILK01008714.1.p1  ORF type:complete len:451 (-),score=79.76 GILK01008714.1:474-1826(-)
MSLRLLQEVLEKQVRRDVLECKDVFVQWIKDVYFTSMQKNSVFRLRREITDITTQNADRLEPLRQEADALMEEVERCPIVAELKDIERKLLCANEACKGLMIASHPDWRRPKTKASPEPEDEAKIAAQKLRIQQSLLEANNRRQALETQLQALQIQANPLLSLHTGARDKYEQLRAELGITKMEAEKDHILVTQGHDRQSKGRLFEEICLPVIHEHIVPKYAEHDPVVLCNVSLRCPRGEFDMVIVKADDLPDGLLDQVSKITGKDDQQPMDAANNTNTNTDSRQVYKYATVLAMVEAKKNINDIADGFDIRQENLSFYTQDLTNYDLALYKNKYFRDGIFDKHVSHVQNGTTYIFDHNSFKQFQRDPVSNLFLDHLYFTSRFNELSPIRNGDFGRLQSRLASDPSIELDSDEYLDDLFEWLRKISVRPTPREVLYLFKDQQSVLLLDDS